VISSSHERLHFVGCGPTCSANRSNEARHRFGDRAPVSPARAKQIDARRGRPVRTLTEHRGMRSARTVSAAPVRCRLPGSRVARELTLARGAPDVSTQPHENGGEARLPAEPASAYGPKPHQTRPDSASGVAAMEHYPAFLICPRCHDRIGIYEPLWLCDHDGTFRRSSYLNLAKHPQRDPTRYWHFYCLHPNNTSPPTTGSEPREREPDAATSTDPNEHDSQHTEPTSAAPAFAGDRLVSHHRGLQPAADESGASAAIVSSTSALRTFARIVGALVAARNMNSGRSVLPERGARGLPSRRLGAPDLRSVSSSASRRRRGRPDGGRSKARRGAESLRRPARLGSANA
jgi:hypothetical protein